MEDREKLEVHGDEKKEERRFRERGQQIPELGTRVREIGRNPVKGEAPGCLLMECDSLKINNPNTVAVL